MIALTLLNSFLSMPKNDRGVLSFYPCFFAPFRLYPYWNTKKAHLPLFIVAHLSPCASLEVLVVLFTLTHPLLRSVPLVFILVSFSNDELLRLSLF